MSQWLLVCCILSFVLQSQVVQLIQTNYFKPWLLLYFSHSCYSLFIPTVYLFYRRNHSHHDYIAFIASQSNSLPPLAYSTSIWTRMLIMTAIFTSASLAWYSAVSKIPIGDITAIYNTSCFFTYILATLFLNESFKWLKLLAVIISISGIVVISLGDNANPTPSSNPIVGYACATFSSVCVAAYEVIYTKICVPAKPSLLFSVHLTGVLGVLTACLGLFLFPIFHYTGFEVFELPPLKEFFSIILVATLGMIYNCLFLLVITFSGPVMASIGILASIPLSSLVDWLVLGTHFGWNIGIGSICIFLGYFILQSQLVGSMIRSASNASTNIIDSDQESLIEDANISENAVESLSNTSTNVASESVDRQVDVPSESTPLINTV
ncbi:hypothetical protein BC833DRAFT_585217 [Globomyces pollinis-pini]|nr:hypothetical protein BC833DRAFT_585217 [Globomyces pollinis-pini]